MQSFAFVICLIFGFLSLLVSKTQDDVRNAGDSSDSDIEIVFEQQPTVEQAELARKLMLPLMFFIYKNKPGYESDDSDGKSLSLFVLLFSDWRLEILSLFIKVKKLIW